MERRPTKTDRQALMDALNHYTATTIPVHVDISAEGIVLCFKEAEAILRAATAISLGPCTCRREHRLCDGPIDSCLAVDETARRNAESVEGFRLIGADEALEVLRVSHKAGLVHLAYRQRDGEIGEFCSCCSCCCWFLTKVKALGAFEALSASPYIASRDEARCIACDLCAERCPFGAWRNPDPGEAPRFESSRCYGCGVCVSGCPTGALRLEERVMRRTVSED
jgi:Pyruvate/2-oxoacid:ferredoxin oxidoreductase delta subunit